MKSETNAPAVILQSAAASSTFGRSFTTALLLTASVELAEAALLESIQTSDPRDARAGSLLRGAVEASIRISAGEQRTDELMEATSILPAELQQVLYMSRELRQCLVLRVFLNLSHEVCARLLKTETGEIDERTCEALRELSLNVNRARSVC